MEANDATITEQQQLVSDMKSVIADAEDMLAATADQAGDKVASLRARIQERLHGARARLSEAETGAGRQDPRCCPCHRCLCA